MEHNNSHVDNKKAEKKTVVIRYKECLKNHAASLGGNATDGCGEFMPCGGEDGTLDSLKCSACNCHRNFHRKEIESDNDSNYNSPSSHHDHQHYILSVIPNSNTTTHQMMKPIFAQFSPNNNKSGSISPSDDNYSDDQIKEVENGKVMKKRFRTKFTQEQKEKMLGFAEKAGWRIQKLEESMVQKFCQEVGIKRRVLKVWMHNNKNTFAKRSNNLSTVAS